MHETNPLLALVRARYPDLDEGQARVLALEWKALYGDGIGRLAEIATAALGEFDSAASDRSEHEAARAAALTFLDLLRRQPIGGSVTMFLAIFETMRVRVREVVGDGSGSIEPAALRRLFEDLVATKTGGPAAT